MFRKVSGSFVLFAILFGGRSPDSHRFDDRRDLWGNQTATERGGCGCADCARNSAQRPLKAHPESFPITCLLVWSEWLRQACPKVCVKYSPVICLQKEGAHRNDWYPASGIRSQSTNFPSNSNPSIPGILMSDNTKSGKYFLSPQDLRTHCSPQRLLRRIDPSKDQDTFVRRHDLPPRRS